MRLSRSALLWAAFCCQLVVASAEPNFGRFGSRFRRSNISLSSHPDPAPSPTDSLWISTSVASTDDINSPPVASTDASSTDQHATKPPQISNRPGSGSLRSHSSQITITLSDSTSSSMTRSSTGPYYCGNCTAASSLDPNSTTLIVSTISLSSTTSISTILTTSVSVNPASECFSTKSGAPSTVISVVYTSTITWHGSPGDYPGTEDVIPTPCPVTTPRHLTVSTVCTGSSAECSSTTAAEGFQPFASAAPLNATYTFITTAKNPSVYYATSSATGYGDNEPPSDDNHFSAVGGPATVPDYGSGGGSGLGAQQVQSSSDVVVQVRPTQVIINSVTVDNNPVLGTTNTVTVGTDVFTVGPSSVVGAGATVTRSVAAAGYVATTTTVNGIGIVVSSAQAIIDGSTFSLGSTPATQIVQGQTVTLSPGGVAISGVTVPVTLGTAQTQVVVAGGELITAIGQSVVVVSGTSYTYGPGSATVAEVVDDDTVYIGPSGVVVDGTTFGGITAANSGTEYEIVGGATISEVGSSVVVIAGATWTVGPGANTATTVIGGETITIGPSGVEIGTSMTLSYPFGPTSTTTIHPGSAATTAAASATAVASKDDEDGGFRVGMRPNCVLALLTTCIAIGVGFVGYIV